MDAFSKNLYHWPKNNDQKSNQKPKNIANNGNLLVDEFTYK